MDTPLPSAFHKENVHIGGGKATVLMKPDKIKAAGKDRKALADLRSTHGPAARLSKDLDFKLKSVIKGSKVKKNPMAQGRRQKAEADLCATKKHLVTRVSKGANLNTKSVPLSNLKENRPLDHFLTDEEIKQCYEWANDGVEGMGGYSWSKKDEGDLMNQTISEIMASAIGVPVAELEESFLCDEEGYETDGSDLYSSMSFPGRLSSIYTPEELDDPVGVARIVLDEYPLPELMLDED